MATTTIKNGAGSDVVVELPLAPGQAARAASRPVTLATEDITAITGAAIPAGSNAIGTVGVTALPALPAGSNAIGTVGVTALPAIPAGANLIGSATAVGAAAHDAVASGNPVLVGAYASAAAPTAVSADGDAVRLWALRNGAQAVNVTAAGALIGGDATNGLDVDVTRMSSLVAGEAFIGKVGGVTVVKDVTLTIDTAAYAAGELLADTQQVAAALRVTNGTGALVHVVLVDEADIKAPLTLYFLSANASMGTENAMPSISDANAASILGRVRIETADYDDLGGVSVATVPANVPLVAVTGTSDIYVAAVLGSSAATYGSASALKLRLGIQQD